MTTQNFKLCSIINNTKLDDLFIIFPGKCAILNLLQVQNSVVLLKDLRDFNPSCRSLGQTHDQVLFTFWVLVHKVNVVVRASHKAQIRGHFTLLSIFLSFEIDRLDLLGAVTGVEAEDQVCRLHCLLDLLRKDRLHYLWVILRLESDFLLDDWNLTNIIIPRVVPRVHKKVDPIVFLRRQKVYIDLWPLIDLHNFGLNCASFYKLDESVGSNTHFDLNPVTIEVCNEQILLIAHSIAKKGVAGKLHHVIKHQWIRHNLFVIFDVLEGCCQTSFRHSSDEALVCHH